MDFNKDVMGHVFWDREAKEYVLVTNGICKFPHPHNNQEAFNASHANGMASCEYEAHEAIAIRALIEDDGTISVGWTYRGVKADKLAVVSQSEQRWKQMFTTLNSKKIRAKLTGGYIGRI
jgi:hypothetical protein